MSRRYRKIWQALPFAALGLMLAGDFAPVSDSVDEILSGMAISVLLTFSAGYFRQERQARQAHEPGGSTSSSNTIRKLLDSWILLPAFAFGLLALGTLAPISALADSALSCVAIAILLVYVGVPMWEYHRREQTAP